MGVAMADLHEELSQSAAEFSRALRKLATAIDADISAVVRNSVLRAFRNVVKRSPVDTGAYRGSHGIANFEPSDTQDAKKAKKGETVPPATAKGWTWQVGDGDIWMYNNVPYAERIENGWSHTKAPQGVYRMAIPEITQFINQELAKIPGFEPIGGGGEE
jgi:hypothetical protein